MGKINWKEKIIEIYRKIIKKISEIPSKTHKMWDKQVWYALIAFIITSAVTSLSLLISVSWGYFAGKEWGNLHNDFFGNIDIFLIIVSIMASAIVVKCVAKNERVHNKVIYGFITGICYIIGVFSLIAYCNKENILSLDVNRVKQWFITSISFATLKVLISYYIPKKER
ncbi:MAG: hypothetical protein J1F01_00770 [Oscillospiraceae bacterium]|nr:hypothetical protein [Oscillospiraceae bacterium]